MRLKNTTTDEDRVVSDCASFGGRAQEATEIIERLDNELSDAFYEIAELQKQIQN